MASASKDARGNRGLVAFELEDVPRLVRQAELFPIGTLVEYPGSIDTAEAWGEVIAEDSHNYVVKLLR
jgi:hypothetical protein